MAGAEKIGEAFVEMGAKLAPLKKDFDTAKSMTGGAIAEMGKMTSRFAIGLAGKAGLVGGAVALATKSVTEFAGVEMSLATVMQEMARRGEDVDAVMAQLAEGFKEVKTEFRAGALGAGISTRELSNLAKAFLLSGIGVEDFASKARAAIFHSDRLGISLEETAKRMVQVYEGAPAVTTFRLPVSPELPAPMQFAEVLESGQDISAATIKLKTMSGAWRRFSRLTSDFFALLGAGIGVATPLALGEKDFAKLKTTTQRDAARLSGKTAAERRARMMTPGSSVRDVLTDEELTAPARARTGLMGPPAPIPQPGAGPAGEGLGPKLDTIIELIREGVGEAGAAETRPFFLGRHMDSEVRIDTIPTEP